MTRRLNVLYKRFLSFVEISLTVIQVIEQTRFCDGQTDGQIDGGHKGKNNMSPGHSLVRHNYISRKFTSITEKRGTKIAVFKKKVDAKLILIFCHKSKNLQISP